MFNTVSFQGFLDSLRSLVIVIAGSTGNLCIVRCPIRSGMTSTDVGMTSIDELSEFRADDEFLVVTLFHAADHLCIYAEAL